MVDVWFGNGFDFDQVRSAVMMSRFLELDDDLLQPHLMFDNNTGEQHSDINSLCPLPTHQFSAIY